jgi:Peptidase C10 family/Carbohydrate family 9 binding domain-like/Concanavalin A-like lectin/glucanases superfamily/Secretion system C-terminal sorting domain
MRKLHLIIIGLLISFQSISQTTVKKVTSKVALDGILEESFWDISNPITTGSSNNTANFGVLWDDTYLYVGVNVTDGTLCSNKRQGFYDDAIEICIDGNNNQGTSFDSYDRIFVKPIRSYWIQEMERRYSGVIHNWIETGSGYTMEFAIPWANFNTTPAVGLNIGFNVVVNDDEDSNNPHNTPTQLIWNGNSNYYNNPSLWGTINLSAETVSFTADYLAIINPNGGDFCINNKTTEIEWVSNGITNIDIDYSTDNGSTWNSITTNLTASLNSYSWDVSATASEQCLIKIYETGNSSLNDISEDIFTIAASLTAVEPLIPNTWKNYQWPYNAYFPEDASGINGHVGSACGHASLARIMHYWEFPIVGNDQLNFTDNAGHTWSANFGATTYNYDNMPNYLSGSSSETEYTDVATLTYHAATSMDDYYGTGRDLDNMSYAMSHYFNYKVSTPAIRSDFTKAEWIKLLINELDNGRVLLIDGMTTEVLGDWHENNWVAGHWFHIDGYNEDGQFHGVLGYGDEDAWFDINSIFDYYLNNGILIGLEPNLNGKSLSLQNHNGGAGIEAGQTVQINWNSTGISNIKIEYTIDNGQNWIEIINSISAASGTYNWTVPDVSSNECKIKLKDLSDVNVYDKSNDVFSISLYGLELISPNGGEFLIAGGSKDITWESTPVSNIKIECSINNGSNWTEIIGTTPTSSEKYSWTVPNETSSQCLIKITDVSNATVFDVSESNFEIGEPNNAGGPYVSDENTVLLLHFDNNIDESSHNYTLSSHGTAKTYINNPVAGLSDAIYFDNSLQTNDSYITVPNTAGEMSLNTNWTIEFWLYIESWDQSYNNWPVPILLPVGGDANFVLEIPPSTGNLKYVFSSNNGNVYLHSSENTITTGKWYHVALMNDYDNHTTKLLLHDSNFQKIEEKSYTYPAGTIAKTATQDLRIGAGLFSDNHFNGYIDELRISNVVRSFDTSPDTRILLRSNSQFEVWGQAAEEAAADTVIKVLTANYNRIADSLNIELTQTVVVDVYPDLTTYHTAIGWPDAPDWVVGTATGDTKIDLVSPYNPGPVHSFGSIMSVITHELVHCFVHKLANEAIITTWLNEGTASFLSYQVRDVCYYHEQNGEVLPTLDELNDGSTFGNIGGYAYSHTIVEFIINDLGGSSILSQFIASGLDYSVLGFSNKEAFQSAWYQYLYLNYSCTTGELTLISPNGGESFTIGESTSISWGNSTVSDIKIEYSVNNGSSWTEIIASTSCSSKSFNWTLPEESSIQCLIKISDVTNSSLFDKSDSSFDIDYPNNIDNNNSSFKDLFVIYPNPANKIIHISAPEVINLSIYNMAGQKIIDKEDFKSGDIILSEFANGIYTIIFTSKEKIICKKFIKY